MNENIDNYQSRIECFNRVGEYTLNEILEPQKKDSYHSFIAQALNAPFKEMAKEKSSRLGYDVEEWQGKEDELYLYLESRHALAAFRLAENLEGIKKIREFMKNKGVPYDSELELRIMEDYHEFDDKRIKEMIKLYD